MPTFDCSILGWDDRRLAARLLAGPGGLLSDGFAKLQKPDLEIAPMGEPYLYRWRLTPYAREAEDRHGNTYLHVQVASDPDRPLHDHPWDNMSLILAGGYDEIITPHPELLPNDKYEPRPRKLRQGDLVFRKAEEAHRLILPVEFRYTMTQFSTGPVRRPWGFWTERGWVDQHEVLDWREDGVSIWKGA